MKTAYRTATAVLPAVLAAFLATACGNGTEAGLPADAPVPVEIAGAGIDAGVQTRATITGGSIGVFRTGAGYPEQYERYTYNNGWVPSANTLYVGGADATVCAYYPYDDAAVHTGTAFILEAQGWSGPKDLSYATTGATVSNKVPVVSFAMKRAYARLKLSITRTANYVGNCNVANVNIRHSGNNCFLTRRTLDISNNTSSGDVNTGGGWTNGLNLGNIAPGATNTAYDALVPPQPVNGGLIITLPIDGVNRSVNIDAGYFNNRELGAGRQYTISLTITDVAVILNGNININDMVWDGTVIQNNDPIKIF